jgi:cell division protein FtsB
MTLNEIVKTTFDSVRAQLVGLEKRMLALEKRAQKSVGEVQTRFQGAAGQVERVFTNAGKQIRGAVTFATRAELESLAAKVEDLADKVDKLSRGEKPRPAARKPEAA